MATTRTAWTALRRWWRWYRPRFGHAPVVAGVGAFVWIAALAMPLPAWSDETSAPLAGSGLVRVPASGDGSGSLLPAHDPCGRDAHDARIVAVDGTALVGERLGRCQDGRAAELAVRRARARAGARGPRALDGFHDVGVQCRPTCRPALVGRHDEVVILLTRLAAPAAPEAERGDRALSAVRRLYAERVGLDRGPGGSRSRVLAGLFAAGGVALLFGAVIAWQVRVARRAPRTPHRHLVRAPSPQEAADVCVSADASRRRGYVLACAQAMAFTACAVTATVVTELVVLAAAAAPVSWLIVRRFGNANPSRQRTALAQRVARFGWEARIWVRELMGHFDVPTTPASRLHAFAGRIVSAYVKVQLWPIVAVALLSPAAMLPASRRPRLKVLALRGAARWLTLVVWTLLAYVVLLPSLVESLIRGRGLDASVSAGNPGDVVRFAVQLAWLAFTLLVLLSGLSAVSRLARRLRAAAAARDQERRPRPLFLYLRAFDDDRRLLSAGGFGGRPSTEIFSFRARIPFDEVLAKELDRHGLVVALAEPGTPGIFLPLGPPRHRLSERDWREGVLARMRDAALVVIGVGTTEGLLWELAAATREGLLDRVLLVVPPDDDDTIRARWQATAHAIATSGGPDLSLPVDAASALAVRVGNDGVRRVVVADRRDEHTYALALARAAAPSARAG